MPRQIVWKAALALALMCPVTGQAQGIPELSPINPVSSSRSGLYFQPMREAQPGRWVKSYSLEYASVIEYNPLQSANYVLDSELLRFTLGVSRDLGPRTFLKIDAALSGSYAGFLDPFLNWYHARLGIRMSERERRPADRFLYEITLPDGQVIQRKRSSLFLQDTRIGIGWRVAPQFQAMLSATLPTATAPAGYGRGVPSISLLNTFSAPLGPRMFYEGSAGVGYTPAHGELQDLQRRFFIALTSGVRMAVWGRQSLFANLFYHSPYYHDTTLPALDRRELSLDFGWLVQTRMGTEWRIGMTEDLEPGGPGVDLVFRLGRSF